MKYLLILILFLFNYAHAQYPRHANVALIETDSVSGYPFFLDCLEVLQDEGYSVKLIDEVPNALITEPVEIHDLPLLFRLELEVKGPYARLHGYIMDDRDFKNIGLYPREKKWVDATYRSFRGSTWRLGFDEVVVITEKVRSRVYGKVQWHIEENTLFFREEERTDGILSHGNR
jgi:hypothetical protein